MILHRENPKDATRKLLELINEFGLKELQINTKLISEICYIFIH